MPSNRSAAVLAAAALLLALTAAPSQAAAGKRVFEGTFGSAAQPTFERPQGITVDYGTGDLYVIGFTAKTISRWHADGTPSPFPALGTNVIDGKLGPGGKPCAEEPASCDAASVTVPGGLEIGSDPLFTRQQAQVALDESGTATDGNIYLSGRDSKAINIFAADGHYLGQLTKYKEGESADGPEVPFGNELGRVSGVAVDRDGSLYVSDKGGNGLIHVYVPQGLPHNPPEVADNVANFSFNNSGAIAAGAGPSDGYLFVKSAAGSAQSGPVYKLDSSTGAQVGSNPIVSNGTSTVSVFPDTGNVFVGTDFTAANKVKEFDASGPEPVEVSFAQPVSGTAEGFALAASGNRLFTSRVGSTSLQIFSAPLPTPVVVTNPATNVAETGATLNGTVDRKGLATENCKFEYIGDAAYLANKKAKVTPFTGASSQACAESNATIDAGAAPVSVHADLAGLKAGELFHYRLSATTFSATSIGDEQTFATTVPPAIESEAASAVTESEATIKVLINPKFYATTFHIEYGPGSSFAQSTPETAVGSDGTAHPLAVFLKGLSPGTTYGWRVVATSANGLSSQSADHSFTTYRPFVPDTGCPNQGLRGGPSAALPDCRAYEMVSPIDKNGDGIVVRANLNNNDDAYVQATPDGAKIAYSSGASFAGQLSSHYYNQYISARGGDSWATSGVNAPLAQGRLAVPTERWVSAFSEDLCSMWFSDFNETPLNPDAQEGFRNLYRRQNCAPGIGSFETLTTAPPPAGTPEAYVAKDSVQGVSADGKAAFFVANAQLPTAPGTPEAADVFNQGQVYLRLAGDPDLRLVSVLPSGKANETSNAVGGGSNRNLQNAVSEDGTRVFWSAGQLYLRLNPAQPETAAKDGGGDCVPDPVAACTIEVSEGTATFWDATPSGSAALYSEGQTLYRFDVATRTRTALAGKLFGVAGASEDLGRIYLVSGEDRDGAGPAAEDQRNLYLYEGGSFTFVGTLLAGDSSGDIGVASASPIGREARVTPDGGVIVFQSRAPLSGYDNTEAETGEAAVEVFRYEAGGALLCVSCNPAGIRPRGDELPLPYRNPLIPLPGSGKRAAAWIPTWEHPLHASRLISEDGNRVFFHSFDPLVPRDSNGTVQDLYQWEAPGTGSCDSADASYFPQNGGCLSLISSGDSSERSLFLDASSDGSDVFFTTESSLVPQDPGLIDIYDARVGGGYPPPVAAAACEGEACQSPPPPPADATPASSAYRGPGDVKPAAKRRCAKGKRRVRRKGKVRCVSRKQRRQGRGQRRANHDRRNAR